MNKQLVAKQGDLVKTKTGRSDRIPGKSTDWKQSGGFRSGVYKI